MAKKKKPAKRRSGPKKTSRTLTPEHKAQAIKNLKPWKKGQSGNPNGRPKILPKLDKLLRQILGGENEEDEQSVMAEIILELVAKVKDKKSKQSVRAAEILLERAYGRVSAKEQDDPEGKNKPKTITGFKINRK